MTLVQAELPWSSSLFTATKDATYAKAGRGGGWGGASHGFPSGDRSNESCSLNHLIGNLCMIIMRAQQKRPEKGPMFNRELAPPRPSLVRMVMSWVS